MKNYFKTYYKTRISQGVLGEQASEFNNQLMTDALTKHKNIMEGYNPNGRDSGIMEPEDRAKYIKHFTNFIKESYFEDLDVNWTKARDTHNSIINNHNDLEYLSNFTDFMNSPTTNIILENAMLSEEEKKTSTFEGDVADAVRKHVNNPSKTVLSSRGDNFDTLDVAHDAAKTISYYMKNKGEMKPHEKAHLQKKITYLKHILPDEHVSALIKKHFPEND